MGNKTIGEKALERGGGILRLAPTWVPRKGYGTCGCWEIETPTLIRYGQLTNDEFFVTEAAAKSGVTIQNRSKTQPLVLLKHFSENPDLVL